MISLRYELEIISCSFRQSLCLTYVVKRVLGFDALT